MTYLNIGFRTLFFLLIELLSCILIGWVFKVGTEESQVFLLLGTIFCLVLIEFGILTLHFLLDQAIVPGLDVVIGASGNLRAEILESL